jgi:TolB-like protein/DNA-binding winged helix-turn-helix (wHTH) protein/Tfp pilus assembly protein PilF
MQDDLRIDGRVIEPQANTVRAGRDSVRLEPKVMQVLLQLARQPGQVVSKEKLLQSVWADTFVTEDVLTRSISALRKVFDDNSRHPRIIETIPKSGYRLIAPVEWLPDDSADSSIAPVPGVLLDGRSSRAPAAVSPRAQEHIRPTLRRGVAVALLAALAITLAAAVWHLHRQPAPQLDSLAVLPFADLSSNADGEYLSDGLALGVIDSLAHVPNLKVISQASTLYFKGQKIDPQVVGRKLGVNHLVLGRVAQHDGTLEVSVELVDARDSHHLWGQEYAGRPEDILSLQQEISRDVGEAMQVQAAASPHLQTAGHGTGNQQAYQLYLMGRYFWNKRTEEGLTRSIDYFQQAIAKDPSFALAYAGLADAYDLLSQYGVDSPQKSFPKAEAAALQALKLDDSLAEAHNSLAFAKLYYEWDWSGAEREFRRALELDPGYATAHHWYSSYLESAGRMDEAFAEARRAQELDPLSLVINLNVAEFLIHAHRIDEAKEQVRKVLELDPNYPHAHLCLALCLMEENRHRDALLEAEKAAALSGNSPAALLGLAYAYGTDGNKEKAVRLMEEAERQSGRRYISPVEMAAVYAVTGDKSCALDLLERAYQNRDDGVIDLGVKQEFDSLRSEPRFQNLVRRLRLPGPVRSRS